MNTTFSDIIKDIFIYNHEKPILFNSVLFFGLFTVLYTLYSAVINKVKTRNILLLIFSLFFYYKISGITVVLLVFIGSSDFIIAKLITGTHNETKKKLWLFTSLFINISCLLFFKYINFLISIYFDIAHPDIIPFEMNLISTVGISFFIFKTISYIIDVYDEDIEKPERNYLNYLLYLSYFPNILAGPISRAKNLLPQINGLIMLDNKKISKGLFLIMLGAFKKYAISDSIAANFVNRVFDSPHLFSGFENLMAGYGALLQIFFDFSGYTDMMIGISLLLGFKIEENFNQPFKAQNISEFWRRWHMTLSRWLFDYLFNRISFTLRKFKYTGVIFAAMFTFFISGLWHGANWTFIIWGLMHGAAISWDIITSDTRDRIKKITNKKLYKILSIFLTFQFLSLTMIMFKSSDINIALTIYSKIFSVYNIGIIQKWIYVYKFPLLLMIIGLTLQYLPVNFYSKVEDKFSGQGLLVKVVIVSSAVIFIYQFISVKALPFVYLEF